MNNQPNGKILTTKCADLGGAVMFEGLSQSYISFTSAAHELKMVCIKIYYEAVDKEVSCWGGRLGLKRLCEKSTTFKHGIRPVAATKKTFFKGQ